MTTSIPYPPFPSDLPTAQISTVDYDELVAGDPSSAQAVLDAARGYGFFYLKNHHVDSSAMFSLGSALFALPKSELKAFDMGTNGSPVGYKSFGAAFVDEKGTPDANEFYNISKDDVLAGEDRRYVSRMERSMLFP